MSPATPRFLASFGAAVLLWASATRGDVPASTPAEPNVTADEDRALPLAAVATWSGSAAVATYFVPHTRVYAQPTLTADHDWLHLEARYNYENLDTGSLWLGYNLGIGDRLTLAFTPMVGGVFGAVTGVAPGFKVTVGFWKLELYSEAEYLFDTDDHTGNFAYAWSEFTLAPLDWMRVGLVSQRTRAYETDVDIQRGLLAGVSYRWLSLTADVFNLDRDRQTVVVSVGVTF